MLQGVEWRASASSTPAAKRSRRAIMRSNASSVSTSASVARAARERQGVARERAAHAAGVLEVGVLQGGDPLGQLGAHPVGADRHAAADRLAERDRVGLEAPGRGAAARAGAQGVGLVDDQQRAVAAAGLPHGGEEAVLGQHDADVRERRLHQHARHVAVASAASTVSSSLNSATRVVSAGSTAGPTLPARERSVPPCERDERLVDRAVVAPVEDEHPRPAGHLAADPQEPAVGVGRRERELPERNAEAARELVARPRRRPPWGASW